MYKAEYTTSPLTLNYVYFYENISAYVDLPDTVYFLLKFTGRDSNYQRSIVAYPANGDYTSPSYDRNNRYFKFGFRAYSPKTDGSEQTMDIKSVKLIGNVVLSPIGIYDVKVYYTTTYNSNSLSESAATLIPEIKPVVYVTDENRVLLGANWTGYESPDFVTYTKYAENDLTDVSMSNYGKPASASVDNRDVEYGVQTWTPNYSN